MTQNRSAAAIVSLEEYLANPVYKHCEYIDGVAVDLNLGTGRHGHIQIRISRKLDDYLERNPIGYCYAELHCRLKVKGRVRYRLPDVSAILGSFVEGHAEDAPDLCAEIRSPEDKVTAQIAKFSDYFSNGCKLGWLVVPEERTVLILTPGSSPRVASIDDTLDGGDILPGLEIPVAALFA